LRKRHEVPLKYLKFDRSRHGKPRLYVRAPGRKMIRLPVDSVDDPNFSAAYAAALAGDTLTETAQPSVKRAANKPAPGSLRELSAAYLAHIAKDHSLADRTKYVRRRHLDEVCQCERIPGKDSRPIGDAPVSAFTPMHIQKLLDRKAETPEAANDRRKVLNGMWAWGLLRGYAATNPVAATKPFKTDSDGHIPWSWQEINRFAERHPAGTKPYLALALLLYTGQRLSDVIRMGRQHVRNGALHFRQKKGGREMGLTIVPGLQAALDTVPTGQLTFLVTEFGKPYTAAGFGNWFRRRVREAGLADRSAHGLRKSLQTIGAEDDLTDRQLMAVAGHETARETTRYTKKRDRDRLAAQGMAKLFNLQIGAPGLGVLEGAPETGKKANDVTS
jgi:integrase